MYAHYKSLGHKLDNVLPHTKKDLRLQSFNAHLPTPFPHATALGESRSRVP